MNPIKATVLDDDKFRLLAIPFGGPIPHPAFPRGVDLDGETFTERTDIKAAWQVVEKMREKGYLVDVEMVTLTKHWACDFFEIGKWTGFGDTAPEAICRAALEAVA